MSGEVPSDVPPATFGRFRVLHQIGVGSLGPVFRAEDPTTGEAVAVRQLRVNLPPEKAHQVADALRELCNRLPRHSGLLRVIDAGLHRVDPFVVTELATGESLDVALREYGPASIIDALPRLQRVAEALDGAATAGIWHGALQPRDILVSGQDTRMAGIGVVPILERAGVHRPARRPYGAPEVVDGGSTSPQADQYALAAIAYEWLFGGRAPRSAESVLDAPTLQGVNAEVLASALMTALAPDPARRFDTCGKFVEAMRAAVNGAAPGAQVAEPRASQAPIAATLPLDSREPAGAEPVEPILTTEPVFEIVPPPVRLTDFELDPTLASPPFEAEVARPRAGAVAWQGSLGASRDPMPEGRRRYTAGAVAAALVAGVLLGGAGGYVIGSRITGGSPALPAATTAEPTAVQPATPGREFTDAPVAGSVTPASNDKTATPVPAKPETASLLVRTSPAGASVAVDGALRGTTPLTLRDLALGTKALVISRPGYVPIERSITLTADRPSRSVDVQLTPVARTVRPTPPPPVPARASLVVDSRPAGSSVLVDGMLMGTTPLTLATIAPGRHTVRIERAGYRAFTETIDVKQGERRRVAASLEAGQPQQ